MKCSNCGTKLTCGCQKRTAKDGTQCCQSCIASYEAAKKNATNETDPTHHKITLSSL